DALDFQRDYARVHAILGGKSPHLQTYVVGGMALPIDPASAAALNADALQEVDALLRNGLAFVQQAYLPDLLAIASYYREWGSIGRGVGNYLAFGDFSSSPPRRGLPITDGVLSSGVLRGGTLTRVEPLDPARIAEHVTRSWFRDRGAAARSPYDGVTEPHYTGPAPPYEHLDVDGKYSWLKAPRYDGMAVEVGPLARVLIGYARGDQRFRRPVDRSVAQLGVPTSALTSTLGRTLARGLETEVLAEHSLVVLDRLRKSIAGGDLRVADTTKWNPDSWPKRARGVGFHEAPRGGLSHWVEISDKRLARYQAVVPSTWNAGPRDDKGRPGPYEVALVGTPLADPARPLEILRTIHSFDPCMACAAHVLDADGNDVVEVRVQ
ncbi:MAG TPA: nickel-dependent hydrogenase large subunit, partial [Mycobacteriales bacterium]|nr:nickel-dependent hydrogenase large subunit [Mycobacteriales bacterium]